MYFERAMTRFSFHGYSFTSGSLSPGLSITSGGRRPTGKLLTSEDGRGLALLRIELVDAQAQFQVKDEAGGVWNVKPTRPDWWPQSTTPSDTSID